MLPRKLIIASVDEIESYIGELEACSEEDIKKWWDCKFSIAKRRCAEKLKAMGERLDQYPKCKELLRGI